MTFPLDVLGISEIFFLLSINSLAANSCRSPDCQLPLRPMLPPALVNAAWEVLSSLRLTTMLMV